ncbi:transposable element Tcb2 transposase, partial [Trichonephila clavipes]
MTCMPTIFRLKIRFVQKICLIQSGLNQQPNLYEAGSIPLSHQSRRLPYCANLERFTGVKKPVQHDSSTVDLYQGGKKDSNSLLVCGRSHSCVQKIIGRFKSDGLTKNKSGRGRKSILSDVAKRKVLKDIKIDPKQSAVQLAAETSRIMGRSVSAETKKRLEFAKTHQLKTNNFWKKVIFSDKSKFNIFGSDGCRTVWRKPNTALDPKNLRPTVKHGGGSVMVWGCMASNG